MLNIQKSEVDCMEALEWLTHNKNEYAFAANYFGETQNAINFVKELYNAGADLLEVDELYPD